MVGVDPVPRITGFGLVVGFSTVLPPNRSSCQSLLRLWTYERGDSVVQAQRHVHSPVAMSTADTGHAGPIAGPLGCPGQGADGWFCRGRFTKPMPALLKIQDGALESGANHSDLLNCHGGLTRNKGYRRHHRFPNGCLTWPFQGPVFQRWGGEDSRSCGLRPHVANDNVVGGVGVRPSLRCSAA